MPGGVVRNCVFKEVIAAACTSPSDHASITRTYPTNQATARRVSTRSYGPARRVSDTHTAASERVPAVFATEGVRMAAGEPLFEDRSTW